MGTERKKAIKYGIASAALVFLIALFSILKFNSYISEYIFARGISRAVSSSAGYINSVFPFSVFELLTGAAIIYGVFFIVSEIKLLKRRRYAEFSKRFFKSATAALSILLIYTATASFSYYREPLENYLPQHQNKLSEGELNELINHYIDDINELSASFSRDSGGNIIPPYDRKTLKKRLAEEYSKLDNNQFFSNYTPPFKPLISSYVFSLFGITGITFMPTGEASVNLNVPLIFLPQTACHELAHAKGAMRERDAELTAAYITLTSSDPYIRYGGYAAYVYDILWMLSLNGRHGDYEAAVQRLAPAFLKELDNAYKAYEKYSGFVDKIGRFLNDTYLKLSGIDEGVGDYIDYGNSTEIIIEPPEGGPPVVERIVIYSPVQKLIQALYLGNRE
jgi:hypothetical protein